MPSTEWETPIDFFNNLNKEFFFDLDVCALPQNSKCQKFFSPDSDGLKQEWFGNVWMNPPYDKTIGNWVQKAYQSSQDGVFGSTIVCLLPGRSCDTRWWHRYVMRASEIRFIKDRVHFGLDGKFRRANLSSVIVIFRPGYMGPPKTSAIDNKGNLLN